MSHVFVSYAREDREYVTRLAAAMRTHGVDVWLDADLDHGVDWYDTVESQLDDSAAVVLIMSRDAKESTWVKNELLRSQRKGIPVRPLLLAGELWLALESSQYLDVRDGRLPDQSFFDDLRDITRPREQRTNPAGPPNWLDAGTLSRQIEEPDPSRDAGDAADDRSRAPPTGATPEPDSPEPRGRESAGPESAGPESAGPESAGPEPVGPEPASPEPTPDADRPAVGPGGPEPAPTGGEVAGGEGPTGRPGRRVLARAAVLVVVAVLAALVWWSGRDDWLVEDPAPWQTVVLPADGIVVDGHLDDWEGRPRLTDWHETGPADEAWLDPEAGHWVAFAASDDHLYVAAEVTDTDAPKPHAEDDRDIWTGDFVWVFVSQPPVSGSFDVPTPIGSLRLRLAARPTGSVTGVTTRVDFREPSGWDEPSDGPDVEHEGPHTGDGYVVEARVAWEDLPDLDPPGNGSWLAVAARLNATDDAAEEASQVLVTPEGFGAGELDCWARGLVWDDRRTRPDPPWPDPDGRSESCPTTGSATSSQSRAAPPRSIPASGP